MVNIFLAGVAAGFAVDAIEEDGVWCLIWVSLCGINLALASYTV